MVDASAIIKSGVTIIKPIGLGRNCIKHEVSYDSDAGTFETAISCRNGMRRMKLYLRYRDQWRVMTISR